MELKKISEASKIELDNQFNVEMQKISWCDCDCNVKHPKKNSKQVDYLESCYTPNFLSTGAILKAAYIKNPSAANRKKGQEICDLWSETYCYRTGSKKTTSLW